MYVMDHLQCLYMHEQIAANDAMVKVKSLTYLARRWGGTGLCSTSTLLLLRLLPLPRPLCFTHQLGQVELQAPGDGNAEKGVLGHF